MVHRDVQLAILRLLSLGLENPSPNLAHLLLGFDEGSETNLQDPGQCIVRGRLWVWCELRYSTAKLVKRLPIVLHIHVPGHTVP